MKYTKEILEEAAKCSTSVAGILRHLGVRQSGGAHSHISRRLKYLEVDTSHFTGQGHNRGQRSPRRRTPEEVLILRETGQREDRPRILRSMLEVGIPYICVHCGSEGEHNGKPLPLEIDHINRNWLDNRRENLRFLCPNCHSQEDTNFFIPDTSSSDRSAIVQIFPKTRVRADKPKPRAVRPLEPKLPTLCADCSTQIDIKATRCKPCAGRHVQPTKITWPPLEDLLHLVETTSYSSAGRELGVSDNAVRKRIKRLQQEALTQM